MKYMGSKNRHAKHLLKIILPCLDGASAYYEPFVGGANIIDKVPPLIKRIGSDIDPDLIAMWKAVSQGWMPPKEFSEQDYKKVRNGSCSELRGYAAFALSYGGKKFGGWRRDSFGKRNYVDEAYRNAEKQFHKLREVNFLLKNFCDLIIEPNSVVYCDPPYEGTTKYTPDFDHTLFWQWVRNISKENKVFVSEYSAPDDFECIWQKEVTNSLTKDTGSKIGIEKLFIYKSKIENRFADDHQTE